jgi:hypothetical protein
MAKRRPYASNMQLEGRQKAKLRTVCHSRGIDPDFMSDQVLCNYLNDQHESDPPFWLAKHAILFTQTCWRSLRSKLPRAWDVLRSWQQTRSTGTRKPMPFLLARALFSASLNEALLRPAEAAAFIGFAVLMRVTFWALLRPGEMFRLTVGDCMFSDTLGSVVSAVIALACPKTRNFGGRHQYCIIYDLETIEASMSSYIQVENCLVDAHQCPFGAWVSVDAHQCPFGAWVSGRQPLVSLGRNCLCMSGLN